MPNSLNRLTSLLFLSGSLLLATGVLHAQVTFVDPNLQNAVREQLELGPTDPLTLADVEGLIVLVALGKNIVLLGGIEQLSNLTVLDLDENEIIDISPLATMTQLTQLSLDTNLVSDIAPLTSLSELFELNLRSNAISDIGPLANLINLTDLDLISNAISDIGPLANLINLTILDMDFNAISDLTPLTDLIKLTSMDLFNNHIRDIGPLAGLTQLTVLSLSSNVISDLTPLTDLIKLTELDLISNSISDISPLAGMAQLTELHLSSNTISELSPLAGLTQLTLLVLSSNSISDIAALVSNTGLGAGDSIELTSTALGLDDCADLQNLIGRGASVTHNVNCDATVLVANFMNGNNAILNSRVYLYNGSNKAGDVTVRVFTMPISGGTRQELTTTPLPLGSLGPNEAFNIKLDVDILGTAGLGLTLPYVTDGGNLMLEFTVTAPKVTGAGQVFSSDLAFGTYPLQVIQ